MATTVSVGGPPMALVYQREPGPVLRSVLARYFVVGIVISLIGLAVVGELGTEQLAYGAILVPGTVIGFAFSGRLTSSSGPGPPRGGGPRRVRRFGGGDRRAAAGLTVS